MLFIRGTTKQGWLKSVSKDKSLVIKYWGGAKITVVLTYFLFIISGYYHFNANLFKNESFQNLKSDIWNFHVFFVLLATQGGIKSSGRAEGFGMKGQGAEVASPTFTQPLFIADHHRAQMTLKYSIDCEPSCVCENAGHKRRYSSQMTFCC